MSCHQAMSLTFEFIHNYSSKSPNKTYKGGNVYVLKSSYPLCCGFLHMFHVSVFGIVNFLSRGREIYQVVCLRATSQNEHKVMW
jgi:hypothetical protein